MTKMIASSKPKSSGLDPIPTWLLKQSPPLIPALTNIVNHSLSTGVMPDTLKVAQVTPVLKKSTLNHEELKNYRPVSNLAFTSKLIERSVTEQLTKHCERNNISNYYQSAYKRLHSTETALVKVQSDILRAVDSQGGAILVLLDLSAAFDTISHDVLLRTLHTRIGLSGVALQWIKSYLSNRYQSVKIGNTLSTPKELTYGVPQGSVLGPQLFSLYTLPLSDIVCDLGMISHMYADDSQLYIAFIPRCSISTKSSISTVYTCTSSIQTWMRYNFLQLNGDKTEVLVFTPPSLSGHMFTSMPVCDTEVAVSSSAKDLGVILDSQLRLDKQVSNICKKAYYQIYLIHKIRKYITEEAARTLVQANVVSLLDYCNGLLYGLPNALISRLQRVQNSAARVITQANKHQHITPILKTLHWLPIKQRIDFKIILLTFKCLNGLAPPYLRDLIVPYTSARPLRSQQHNLLTPLQSKLKAYGERSFQSAAPKLWNSLPKHMREITSVFVFKTSLKTIKFREAYGC
jgi:hypothetical protein